ncbi:MAG TPA: tRNA lysidine(34) synthetase TilS [Gemmatimonadaceae bacterium]
MSPPPTSCVDEAVFETLRPHARVVLAVSGGRDSMVMLDAAARVAPGRIAAVATFDHGTGAAATEAAALVERRSGELGLPVIRGRADAALHTEAEWREARWRFLRAVAAHERAVVATAHTRDDQVETVLMRALRDAGARGLAGLFAASDVLHPLLDVPRTTVAAYAERRGLAWVDDPSNRSLHFLRNRVRQDLLPVLERVDPDFPATLLAIAHRAAELREEVERFVARDVPHQVNGRTLSVARGELLRYDGQSLRVLCPALVARVGITLDRRGTHRLAEFIIRGRNGGRIQLSGGYEAVLHRDTLQVRPRPRAHAMASGMTNGGAHSLKGMVDAAGWRFRRVPANGISLEHAAEHAALWMAALPADEPLTVRPWRPGDRMVPLGAPGPRRVKGLLRDAGLDAPTRTGWPVVLAGDQIVWIPGVRRSIAATARPGRPELVYLCERIDS